MILPSAMPFKYQGTSSGNFTALAGLPLFLELANISGLTDAVSENLQLKLRGWSDSHVISSLILLNIAGGESVEDIDRLESDEGLAKLLLDQHCKGMSRQERRAFERRFSKENKRAMPSASSIRRYLDLFHNTDEEKKRVEGKAFIPAANEALQSLLGVNQTLINYAQQQNTQTVATLDQDATLVATNKRTALYSYKKFKAYQPFNTYWHEQQLLLHSEFRDGNVPAGFEQLRIFKESLDLLPEGVKEVFLRSDSAGYLENLIRYCAEGTNERFGVIKFAISANVTAAFRSEVSKLKEEDWSPIYKKDGDGNSIKTDQEWAEVSFVPSWAGKSKKGPDYRYIAIRDFFSKQKSLPGIDTDQQDLPFQTVTLEKGDYKLFGIITNHTIDGNELINWHRARCGDSEKVHCIEKADLAGGQLPSDKFGANAAWWHIMVLAFNLKTLMQKLVLPKSLAKKRMKALRFHLICIAGNVVSHARSLIVKVSNDQRIIGLLNFVRSKLAELSGAPPGVQVGL